MRPQVLALALAIAASACKSPPAGARDERRDEQRDTALVAMRPPRVSILSAIRVAQETYPAGRVLGAGMEIDGDTAHYRACVVEGERLHALRIDAWNRKVVSDVIDDGSRAFVDMAIELVDHPEKLPLDFAKAIEVARGADAAAWPSTVFLCGGDGKPFVYAIELVSRGDVRNFEVDAADGTLHTEDEADRRFMISNLDSPPPNDADGAKAPAISLSESIALARKRQPDGFFLHSEFGSENSHPDYLVVFWTRQGTRIVSIDAASGATRIEGAAEVDAQTTAHLHRLAARSQPLIEPSDAIRIAIASVPGSWASMIDVDRDADPLVYQVELMLGGLAKDVRVRATDGKLLEVRAADESEADL